MLTIPPAIETLLKSKMMVGENRPTGYVKFSGGPPGDPINPFVDGVAVKKILGIGSTSRQFISNPVAVTGGGYAFAYSYKDVNDVYKIGIYFDADEGFFTGDYTFDSLWATGISLVCEQETGTSLFRRSDGKVLLFVTDAGSNKTTVGNGVKVFISDTGSCNDFVYYSTIWSFEPLPANTENFSLRMMNVPVELPNGRLVVTFGQGQPYYTAQVWTRVFAYYSDDQGLTWTQGFSYSGAFSGGTGIGQIGLTSDNRLYFETTDEDAKVKLWESGDGGTSFSQSTGYSDAFGEGLGMMPSLYYDASSDTMYRITITPYGDSYIWRMQNPTSTRLKVWENWARMGYVRSTLTGSSAQIVKLPSGKIAITWSDGDGGGQPRTVIIGIKDNSVTLQPKSITIDRSKGSASQATVVLDNKDGIYSPDGTGEWAGVIWPNAEITVTLGYGAEQVQVFRGLIDEVQMTTYPAELTITARDYSKLALDQQPQRTVDGVTYYALLFEDTTPEAIFTELATMAGWSADKIHVDATGVTIASIQFGHESIADCFQRLAELVSWEWFCDEEGHVYFRAAVDPEAASVYEFIEGVDIFGINYRISDAELYRTVVAWASTEEGGTVKASTTWAAADYNNLLPLRTLIINAADLATTQEGCQAIADTAAAALAPKVREVNFVVVGNPYLQIGDVVKVKETTTTISELYRILEISHQMDAEGSPVFATALRCYHFGAEEEGEEE